MNSRNIFIDTPLKLGHITQGSVFSGAISDNYHGCEVFGVIITARCSIANRKLAAYHYLPIVKYADWMDRDFKLLILENSIKDNRSKLKNILSQNNQSPNIVDQFRYLDIKNTIISNFNNKNKNRFIDVVDKLIELENKNISVQRIIELNNNLAEGLLKRLISHDLAEYYLLEGWDKVKKDHYIVLLNEIKILRKEVFFQIGDGLTFESSIGVDFKGSDIINIEHDDMCFVNAQIKSPFVEHILQRFHYNFGRIGVEDLNHEEIVKELKTTWL